MTYMHMRINHPVFDPSQTAPVYPRFTVQPRTLSAPVALSAPLSSPTRPQTASSVPSPAPDHTTRPAPLCAPLCASTRAPDAAPAVTLYSVPHAQTHAQAPASPCERVHALPRVLYHPSPRTRPERPRKPPVSLSTRAHAPSPAAPMCACPQCSNLHNVDRSTLCKTLKTQKVRKNTCKSPLTAVHYSRTQQARPAGEDK